MAITIRVELNRKPEVCKDKCYPHEGPCGAAEASWSKKPKPADVQTFLLNLLRSAYKKMEGDKVVFLPVKKSQ